MTLLGKKELALGGRSEALLLESNPVLKMNSNHKNTSTNVHKYRRQRGEYKKSARDKKMLLLMFTAHLLEKSACNISTRGIML